MVCEFARVFFFFSWFPFRTQSRLYKKPPPTSRKPWLLETYVIVVNSFQSLLSAGPQKGWAVSGSSHTPAFISSVWGRKKTALFLDNDARLTSRRVRLDWDETWERPKDSFIKAPSLSERLLPVLVLKRLILSHKIRISLLRKCYWLII